MYFLIYGIILVIALSWWFITHVIKNRSDQKAEKETDWISLVNELRSYAPKMKSREQLDAYLKEVDEKIKMYETDYAFLVAFNTIVRETKDRLEPSGIISENQ